MYDPFAFCACGNAVMIGTVSKGMRPMCSAAGGGGVQVLHWDASGMFCGALLCVGVHNNGNPDMYMCVLGSDTQLLVM